MPQMTLAEVPNKVPPHHELRTSAPTTFNQGILTHLSNPMGIPEMCRNTRTFDLSPTRLSVPITPFARCRCRACVGGLHRGYVGMCLG